MIATSSVKSTWNIGPTSQMNGSTMTPKFCMANKLLKWAYLVISSNGRATDLHRARLSSFRQAMNNAGIETREPRDEGPISDHNIATTLAARFEDWSGKGCQLVLIMLPAKSTILYNQIKKLGDVNHGIQTVCIGGSDKFYNQKTNAKGSLIFGSLQYFANVALKVNLKLYGINHVLVGPIPRGQGSGPPSGSGPLGVISAGRTMVLGIDVTHPSPGSAENAPSVAAMVASTDNVLAQWPAVLRIQRVDTKKATYSENKVKGARQEMVSEIKSMFLDLLKLWRKRNKDLYPENILIYRDGVSESQYDQVFRDELQPLRDTCAYQYPSQMKDKQLPRFTLIIVGKRHHTRFFPRPNPTPRPRATATATPNPASSSTAPSPTPTPGTSTSNPTPPSKAPHAQPTTSSSTKSSPASTNPRVRCHCRPRAGAWRMWFRR